MPEGDTLHKIAATLRPRALDEPVRELWLRDRGRVALPETAVVRDVAAVGKHLLVAVGSADAPGGGHVAHVHLGMRGRVHAFDPEAPPERFGSEPVLRIALERHGWVFRRVAIAEWLPALTLAQHPQLSRLGPDLLDRCFDPTAVAARARAREPRSAADLLLDQRVACGIGNVYKCEVLFLEGLAPDTPVTQLEDPQIARLYERARTLMQQNLGGWRRTTTRKVDAQHPPLRGEPRHFVYGRAGLSCLKCGARVRGRRLGDAARATFWCPGCQPG